METSRRPLPTPLSIKLAQDALTKVQSHRHLGVILSHDLRWNNHVDYILTKATRLLSVIIGPRVPLAHVLNLHQADLGVCLHSMG